MSQATTEFQEEVKERILFLLAAEPLTTRAIEARLGYPYVTVRRAINDLQEDGKIVKFDRRARGARYTLGASLEDVKRTIPSVAFKGSSIPLTAVYLNQGIETITGRCSDAILKAWTTIAITAKRLDDGVPDSALMPKLNRQKAELASARMDLEQLVFLINQLLDNDKLWTLEHLVKFPQDAKWDEFAEHLDALYDHFYGDST